MTPLFTVLLSTHRAPFFLPFAIESVLQQTCKDFELCVISDGAPPETVECAKDFARRDQRVKVFVFEKGERHGEAHLHAVLTQSSAAYVAHLEDDDLWFPNHLEELGTLLSDVDFGHVIHVWAHGDGSIEALPCDLSIPEFRQRFLVEWSNRIGYSVCGYRLEAYRRLPEGWAPSPPRTWPDFHMWRKFYRMADLRFGTRMVVTAIVLAEFLRASVPIGKRIEESQSWLARIRDRRQRDDIIEAAWRSVIRICLHREQQVASLERAREAYLSETNAQFDRILSSKSWRLTRPARILRHFASRLASRTPKIYQ